MDLVRKYDVIVVGGGHAGVEAALASARCGADTLLLTHSIESLGQMSCNPAIGGIGKGHLVKEIDAMGGIMARAIDQAGIQFRILNASKGPAVRATRAQADRELYKQAIRRAVEQQPNLSLFQQGVDDLIVENDRVIGVSTQMGLSFFAESVVLTVGTFLGGKIHVGDRQSSGGRAGSPAANALAERLRQYPFRVDRLKTGTPPRIDGRSLNYERMQIQPGDQPTPWFALWREGLAHPQQVACYITHTTEKTHELIRAALHRSPMYSGIIEGVGPRYCPSIEDKVVRFADKLSHQIFVEPEGLDCVEIYPNGISTSLPFDVQVVFVRSIIGFEQAHITRPGYAIEYDYFDPRDLKHSLETRHMQGLFFAGQINGTTGYEEAAAQGLIAGLNAANRALGRPEYCPRRDEAYIGVLIDDLITNGTKEPYRMFTSRAEYRLMLREDNADLRLTTKARELGLICDARWRYFEKKQQSIIQESARLKSTWVQPESTQAQRLAPLLEQGIRHETNVLDLLRRPQIQFQALMSTLELQPLDDDQRVHEQVEIQAKYDGYIQRQQADIEKLKRNENVRIPDDLDYQKVPSLSTEIKQKLTDSRPQSIGQAARISGVTPAALSILLIYLKKRSHELSHTE